MKTVTVALLTIYSSLTPLLAAQNEHPFFSNAGVRVGVDAENRVDLVSYELFGTIDMDWFWDLSENLRLDLDIETAIGGLSGEGQTAAYARIAPVAELYFGDFPVSLLISSGPSLYSEDTFDEYDIGGHFQFTSSIGFNWEFDDAWAMAYRFQHTSNADLDSPNPGLDMHTISIAYTF
ncbi:acyloxyacyl hydrolase [Coraliomargarita sp. W4R53]